MVEMCIDLPISTEEASSLKIHRRQLTTLICTDDTSNRRYDMHFHIRLAFDISLN